MGDVSELIRKTNEEDEQIRFLHKFPYIACEVICCDTYDVVKAIMTDDHILSMIFNILDQPPPMDPKLAGYFHKVVRTLVRRNADYILLKCSTAPVKRQASGEQFNEVRGCNDSVFSVFVIFWGCVLECSED
jgi:hypothetical protein